MRITGEQNYTIIGIMLGKDSSNMAVNKIRDITGGYLFTDNREQNSDVYSSYWVVRIASYGFLAIISLITILNIMNSISMSVSARIRQYGAMRAVGMESLQVTKMIAAEAATYAAVGTVVGIVSGLLLHYLIYSKVIIAHFGGIWEIPIIPIMIILILVIISCIMAVYAPAKRICNMAVTDTINDL
ncbi:MAG: FtsX-like permease family protein [Lachnospiraceae bacterium]